MLIRRLTSLLLLLFLALPAAAQLSPKDLARLKSVGDLAVSPDGQKIAYILRVQRDIENAEVEDGPAYAELYLYEGGSSRPFVTGAVTLSHIQWTPDGKEIAFRAKRAGDKETCLYAIPFDGGEARKILEYSQGVGDYTFSPDGKRIAFLAHEPKAKKVETREKRGFNQQVVEEDWAFTRVYIANREQTTKDLKPLPLDGNAAELHWSPVQGDNRLVLTLAPNPGVDASYMYRRIRVIDTQGKVLAKIENPGKLGQVSWSPDARLLGMVSGVDINDPAEGHLMVADSKSGALKDLTPNLPGQIMHFAWLDSNKMQAVAHFGCASDRLIIDTGGKIETLPHNDLIYHDISAGGGKVAYVADHPTHPNELFTERRLTNSNPWLDKVKLARQEVINFKARDGLQLEGMLLRPLDGTQPAPLVLIVHGGPESHYSNGWNNWYSTPGQVLAGRGYAVFYPNYRGSTGRGVDFSKTSQGDPAGKEFDDLVDAVDHVVAMGLADKNKVGITGGSYGGYASAWGATYYSERFAASVMFVGISDKISKVGTTDIPDEEFLVHARKRPWDFYEFFRERSPIFHVKKAHTPILIMHGHDDPRVHPSQSMELFRFLKSLGQTPVRLVFYQGEGHGNRKAAARYDYSLRLLRWMDHYLKGPGGEPPPLEIDYDLPGLDT
ncbi:MAG: S9 family peptidase [Candidatus Eremiobacteraeota bacterium]|nr:S9 family peptidase [Candidatus Eremiobacteraeota bacterium]